MAALKTVDSGDSALAVVSWYDAHAERLADAYEGLDALQTHPELFALIRAKRALRVLDVGAGTGRDAAALAALGHKVTAVDPSRKMLRLARALHAGRDIAWKRDALPDLASLRKDFDLILLSGVWMHISPMTREAAFDRLTKLIAPGGTLYITLRSGPEDAERTMWPTDATELRQLALRYGCTVEDLGHRPDLLGRSDIGWQSLLVRRP